MSYEGNFSNAATSEETDDNKFLTFKIGEEQYGVGIDFVTEIIGVIKITPVPDMKEYIKGVINLRGKVIPVMDVRLRFSLAERNHDEKTCIVVVKVDTLEMGLIVDTVSEVIDIPQKLIEPPPKFHSRITEHYIMGIGKVENQVNLLLDLSKLVHERDLKQILSAA